MVIWRLLRYLKSHYKALSAASVILILATFADVLGPYTVEKLWNEVRTRSFYSKKDSITRCL